MKRAFIATLITGVCALLTSCGRAMPPSGVARFTLKGVGQDATRPIVVATASQIQMYFDYGGPSQHIEFEAQIWTEGKALPGSRTSRESIGGARSELKLWVGLVDLKANWPYGLKYELKGDDATKSSYLPLKLPDAALGWMSTLVADKIVDLQQGQSVPIVVYLTNEEKLELPAGSSLEDWAAKAKAAILIRARLAY